jgi:hypothetical protein
MSNNDRPAHDEWGVYDPEQAGFEAILRKLTPDTPKKTPVPDQARPAAKPAAQAPAAEEDNAIWLTPASVLKPGAK